MLLNEFFGKPADIGKKMSKDQDDQKLGDELFWYIVDHDRLHKEFFHPLATKIKKQQDGGKVDKEKTVLEFAPMVKKGCLEFFKSKKMKGHPEKIFNKELFKDMCEKLYDHYSQDIQKGQYTLGISESALTSPMRMQDFVRMADEIHAKMMAANHRNDADEWHRLKQEYEQLADFAKKGMVPESQVDEIFNPSSSLANLLRGIGAVAGDLMPAALAGMGSFIASSALVGPAMGMMVGTTAGNAVFQAMQNQQNKVPGMIQKIIEKYFGSEAEQIEFSVLHAKSAYLGQPEFRWRGKQWPVTLEKAAAEAIVEKHDKYWLDAEKQRAVDAAKAGQDVAEGSTETPQQQQVRAAITKGMEKWDQNGLATYQSQPAKRNYFASSDWASGQLKGINSIDPDGTVVIELNDTTTAGLVKKLAALGGVPGVKTRQLKMMFDPAKTNADGVTRGDVAEGWQDDSQELEDWSKEVNKRLYRAHESQRPALARQLSKLEQKNFGSSLNQGGLTELVHSTLKALRSGGMVHYDPQSVGQMPFGNIVGDDARIIAAAGVSSDDLAGYRMLSDKGIVDNIQQFLKLRRVVWNKNWPHEYLDKFAGRPGELWLQFVKDLGWSKNNVREAVQGNTMAVSIQYWQKAVLARYPNAQFRHQKMMNGATIAIDNNKEVGIYDPKTNYAKVGPETQQGVAKGGQVYGQPQWQMPNAPRPTYTPGKPLPQSLQQKLDGKPNTGRAVDTNGRTQQQWMEAVKKKFPDAKIIQSKMIDGPVTANLGNGKTLTWHKVEQGVAEGNLNELDMFAPVTTYVRLANGEYVAASWRRNQDLSGGNNASFIDIKPLAPNVAKQLGLDQRLNDPNKNYTGVASIASGGGVQSSTPFSDKTIDVVDIMDKKFAKDMGVPDAVFGKIAQWTQQQGVASNKQVPIGEHLEIQMSKFIGRIIANEAIQNNKHRS